MKKIFILIILATLPLAALHAQWYNAYSAKTGLVLSLNLADSTLYSPLQTADPLPVSLWQRDGDKLRVECSSLGFKMTLVSHADTLTGTWRQQIVREDITFLPADTIFQLQRPQTPTPPFRFRQDTVVADYTDSQGNAIHLEGTLTYPPSGAGQDGPYPCLLLVSGSGQQNRDEELMQHRPFLVIADYLAAQGIAVLRYDDRQIGASIGPLDSADTRLFAEDAAAMLRAAKAHKMVDKRRLGIGGHSEGGAIAPMVAAKDADVRFVVMLAGQGCTGREVLLQQNEALFRGQGVGDSLVAIRVACMDELMSLPPDVSVAQMQAVMARHTGGLSKAQRDSISLKNSDAYALHTQLTSSWMHNFINLNPATYLPQVHCPLLALGGDRDCQVLAKPNLERIAALCPQADCRTLPGLNHLFQHCTTGLPDEYLFIEETFAPEALHAIAAFIQGLRN
ncbi:MAG: alpha/beta fold hydrolase [Bacteroidales bacterium]|nr:alpha/beta fold hydrolase [Bacteroidales bacterium]